MQANQDGRDPTNGCNQSFDFNPNPLIGNSVESGAIKNLRGLQGTGRLGPDSFHRINACGERIQIPNYDRGSIQVGHVHFGPGNFFKSLVAPLSDEAMRSGVPGCEQWGISVVSFRSDCADLREQGGLYTLVERGPNHDTLTVIGSIKEAMFARDNREQVLSRIVDPRTKVVSLTITRDGYCLDQGNSLDKSNPEIARDLANPREPVTAIGFIVEGLRRRKEAGLPPFVVLSCDNLPPNGDITRKAVLDFAMNAYSDTKLAAWIAETVGFPNTMVDRISPKVSPADLAGVEKALGVKDLSAAVTEPARRFVIQSGNWFTASFDTVPCGLPPWIRCSGVMLAEDVTPYAVVKAGLVNTTHMVIAWLATRMGHQTVQEALANPSVRHFVRETMLQEIGPTLPSIPGEDMTIYTDWVLERLQNMRLPDAVNRLNNNPSSKIPQRVLAPIRKALQMDRPFEGLATVVASWILASSGMNEKGVKIDPVIIDLHPMPERISKIADESQTNHQMVDAFLALRDAAGKPIFGELANEPRFVQTLRRCVDRLSAQSVESALVEITGGIAN